MRSHVDDRRFGYALAVSIAVHAVALYGGLPLLRESLEEPAAPPPLVTRLVELPKPAEPVPPPPEPRKPEPRREPRKPEAAKPLPVPSPIAEPVREPAPPEPAQPAPQPPVAAQAPASAAAQTTPPVDTRAAEAATAAQYRMQLIAYAQRNKPPYPRVARENNWTGEVTLEITLLVDGQAELGLRRGSGHEVLDKLALDTYQQALRAVPVPSALRGRQVKLAPLRLIYNLTDN